MSEVMDVKVKMWLEGRIAEEEAAINREPDRGVRVRWIGQKEAFEEVLKYVDAVEEARAEKSGEPPQEKGNR